MKLSRREWIAGSAALALLSPAKAIAATPGDDYLKYVHPDLRTIASKIIPFMASRPPLSLATLAAEREAGKAWIRPQRTDIPVQRQTISRGRGQGEVVLYVVNARPGEARPAILHTHGGGYVSGSAQGSVRELQDICAELDCAAVSVEYRLAPETTFAGSIEDNYAGLKWLHANAASLGVDPGRIAVMGESAGGGHAALLAITARDRGEVPLCFQCLIYPMLDDRTGTSRTVPGHVGRLIWTPEQNRFGWEAFLGVKPGGRSAPKGAVPARVADLAGLPPAFIGVGTLDLFHDEDVDYAQRLNAAAVPAELIVVPGGFHGFDGIGVGDMSPVPAPVSVWFNAAKLSALKRGLAAST